MSVDDIRNQFDDDFDFSEEEIWGDPESRPELFGMTPGQRFVLALLLFLATIILSAFCLIVAGKVSLPL